MTEQDLGETSRLKMLSMSSAFVSQDYLDTLNDKNYMKHTSVQSEFITRRKQIDFINKVRNSENKFIAAVDKNTGELVATSILYLKKDTVNIGLLVIKKFSNSGLGAEILIFLIKLIKNSYPDKEFEVGTSLDNLPMRRLCENIGLKSGFITRDNLIFYKDN